MTPALTIGEELFGWRVVGHRGHAVICECLSCGVVRRREKRKVVMGEPCRCVSDGELGSPERAAATERRRALQNVPAINIDLDWDEDATARRLVRERGPLTLEEIAAACGLSRERVRQIEAKAFADAKNEMRLQRVSEEAIREWFGRARQEHALEGVGEATYSQREETAHAPAARLESEMRHEAYSELGRRMERAVSLLEVYAEAAQWAASTGRRAA
jgi:transcriptional regulator with XRE-family HTH domain